MPLPANADYEEIRFKPLNSGGQGPRILRGTKVTRAAVAAEYPNVPIGSIYICSGATGDTGRVYVKLTESGGASGTATDWQKVTTSAAD